MQAQLAEIGVDIRIEALDVNTLGPQLFSEPRDFDGVVFSWIQEFKLDDRDMFDSERQTGPWGLAGTQNPEMDRLLDTLQTVVDRKAAKPLWDEYQRLLVQEQPYTFLYFVRRLTGVRKSLHGVHVDTRSEWVTVHDWWLDPSAR
jgi:peptide/nickel transport system substrate-binding protein